MLTSASLQPQYKCYFISSRHKSTSTKDTDVQNIKTKIGHKLQNNNNRAIKKKKQYFDNVHAPHRYELTHNEIK